MLSCLEPTQAWQDMQTFTSNGKHPVIFSYKEVVAAAGDSVLLWDSSGNWINKRFKPLSVRCGKCILCKQHRAQEIASRALLELKGYPADTPHSFITLTVDDEHIEEVFPGARLDHRPFQLFMKRLRKAGHKCRYLMCGEYGERTHRPHYHAVLFGFEPPARFAYKDDQGYIRFANDAYFDDRGCYHSSALLESLWPFGHVMCDRVNPARIFYVAGYTLKASSEEWEPYVRWSRRPGLGAAYIDKLGWSQMVVEDTEWFAHEKFKSWYYRIFNNRKPMFFSSRYADGRLELQSKERFDKLYLARQGRLLLEQQKLSDSFELQALSARSLRNRADHLRYQLARKSRELVPC